MVLNTNFTDQVLKYLLDALHSKGVHEKDVITVDATKPDYTDTVIRLRSENVDSILAGLDPFSYARFFQALERQNYNVLFDGFIGLDKSSADAQYGNQAFSTAESVTPVLEPVGHENDPGIAEYLSAVKRYYPNQVAALDVYSEGDWVSAKLFVEAIKRAQQHPELADGDDGAALLRPGQLARPEPLPGMDTAGQRDLGHVLRLDLFLMR